MAHQNPDHKDCADPHHRHHHHHTVAGRVGVAFFLNLGFALVELVGGVLTNSMAILSDSLHDFGDAAALGFAWALERKAAQGQSEKFTYGYRRLSLASAILTGCILVAGSFFVVIESVPRLFHPEPVHAVGMLGLACLGVLINTLAFFRLSHGHSLNEKMLKLHFVEDIAGWMIVLLGALIMNFFDVPWMDPLLAIGLSCWVLWSAFGHLQDTVAVLLQAVPAQVPSFQVCEWITSFSEIQEIHHVHIWSLDGETHLLTAHLVVASDLSSGEICQMKRVLKKGLFERFSIFEATLEVEFQGELCHDPVHAKADDHRGES